MTAKFFAKLGDLIIVESSDVEINKSQPNPLLKSFTDDVKCKIYILAQVRPREATLIGIQSGNRWNSEVFPVVTDRLGTGAWLPKSMFKPYTVQDSNPTHAELTKPPSDVEEREQSFFRYIRPEGGAWGDVNPKGGVTMKVILDYDARVVICRVAFCSSDVNFVKKDGRTAASLTSRTIRFPMPSTEGHFEQSIVSMAYEVVRMVSRHGALVGVRLPVERRAAGEYIYAWTPIDVKRFLEYVENRAI